MASLMDRLRGRDPEEEEKIRKRAEQRQAEAEQDLGESVPEEQGLEEGMDPVETALTIQSLGAAGAVRTAGGIAMAEAKKSLLDKLKQKMPKPGEKKGLSIMNDKERGAAVREEGRLPEIAENPQAFQKELAGREQQMREDFQKLKDVRDRKIPAGNPRSRSEGDYENKYWEVEKKPDSGYALTYSKDRMGRQTPVQRRRRPGEED